MTDASSPTTAADDRAIGLWMALSHADMGSATVRPLLARYGSLEALYAAADDDLLTSGLLRRATLERWRAVSPADCERSAAALRRQGYRFVSWQDNAYPQRLYALSSAPLLLTIRGDHPVPSLGVAVVGTRRPAPAAAALATELAAGLAARGLTIYSGLATGIDAAAHRGALQATGGRAVAILGCSHDRLYPPDNRSLAEAIARRGGSVISPYPPNTMAEAQRLVARNRLITALADVVIIAAARPESGSRHAARFAGEQGRPLLAVPGSDGCNKLLAAGQADPLELPIDIDHLAAYVRAVNDSTQSDRRGPAAAADG